MSTLAAQLSFISLSWVKMTDSFTVWVYLHGVLTCNMTIITTFDITLFIQSLLKLCHWLSCNRLRLIKFDTKKCKILKDFRSWKKIRFFRQIGYISDKYHWYRYIIDLYHANPANCVLMWWFGRYSERKNRKLPIVTTALLFDDPSPANPRKYRHKSNLART